MVSRKTFISKLNKKIMKKINWSKIEDGTECVATIKGFPVKSKIRKYGGKIYLCQNLFSGSTPLDGNLLGYNFSWTMNDGSLREMSKDYCQVSEISFDKKKIIKLSKDIPCKFNIINFHESDVFHSSLKRSTKFHSFIDDLRKENVTVMVRNSSGEDISAACGQLVIKQNIM